MGHDSSFLRHGAPYLKKLCEMMTEYGLDMRQKENRYAEQNQTQ
jgi:hypothetical protein